MQDCTLNNERFRKIINVWWRMVEKLHLSESSNANKKTYEFFSRNSTRRIFPEMVFGSSATYSTKRGYLYGAV